MSDPILLEEIPYWQWLHEKIPPVPNKRQIRLLTAICSQPQSVARYYAPATKLVAAGLASFIGNHLYPTESGTRYFERIKELRKRQ